MNKVLAWVFCFTTAVLTVDAQQKEPSFREVFCEDRYGHFFNVTSVLNEEGQNYSGENLFDGYAGSSWVEGAKGDGIGESLTMAVSERTDALALINGYAASKALFRKNNRLKSIQITIERGYSPEGYVTEKGRAFFLFPMTSSVRLEIADHPRLQSLALPLDWESIRNEEQKTDELWAAFAEKTGHPQKAQTFYFLTMTIKEVYPGSVWTDTCLSELRAYASGREEILSVGADGGMLFYQEKGFQKKILYRDPGLIMDILAVSPDNQWCITLAQYVNPERMRETGYFVFHVPLPAPVTERNISEKMKHGCIPIGFIVNSEGLFLEWDNEETTFIE
ncbi:MAG TPA: hypothetical protein ENN72_01860 [Firmicutes bacterium]|nr:hypothetical protein [Bacillota bacterium]